MNLLKNAVKRVFGTNPPEAPTLAPPENDEQSGDERDKEQGEHREEEEKEHRENNLAYTDDELKELGQTNTPRLTTNLKQRLMCNKQMSILTNSVYECISDIGEHNRLPCVSLPSLLNLRRLCPDTCLQFWLPRMTHRQQSGCNKVARAQTRLRGN
jgi:hypothetical protein